MKIMQEQLSFHGSLRYTTHKDVGSAENAGAVFRLSIHGHIRTAITYKDVGYEDNAGAIIFPWLFAIYRPSMDIKKQIQKVSA
jgi:hypothetical protein